MQQPRRIRLPFQAKTSRIQLIAQTAHAPDRIGSWHRTSEQIRKPRLRGRGNGLVVADAAFDAIRANNALR